MFRHLAAGDRPFNLEAARKMRKYAWFMLLFLLYNVPLGLIAFGLTLLFSYIMEYGGYIQQQADETNRIQEEMIVSFAEITENKSGQTGRHIKRVSEYTRILAEQMGYPPETVESMRIASTMHDIGKLMIPSEILDKPGRLTDEEYAVIKRHTTYGGELLKNVEGGEMALSRTIALQHHERVDGNGYPARLSGEEISMAGKIVAVADVYDALTSKRSYKDAWREADAAAEIEKGSGTQFDAGVVEAFRQAHDRIAEAQRKYRD
jgi:HD-GYP domain-containing protein (c-di-GMP phosphodiesterase class II)